MNNLNSPLMRILLDAYDNPPSKSSLLQSLMVMLPNYNLNMQATINVDETLLELLDHAASMDGTDRQLTDGLREHYDLTTHPDHTATNDRHSQIDPNATFEFATMQCRTEPVVQATTPSNIPSLTHIINNSNTANVWVANDPVLDRQIVLKEYDNPSKIFDPLTHDEAHFLREAQITGQLEHPNIIPVYTVSWNKDGRPYYTMKHIDGDTLAECIDVYHRDATQHTLRSLRPLLDIFIQVCRAIAYAHTRGVIHRDIKPSNIAIGSYGEVMVIDWGLGATARTLSETARQSTTISSSAENDPTQTSHGPYQGTPNYMSPEQVLGGDITKLTDVYSLGGVLFTLLTGRPPRSEASQSAHLSEMFEDVSKGRIPTVDTIEHSIPRQLVAIVNKAMHCKPERRYQDVSEITNDLQSVFADDSIKVYPDTAPRAVARWIRKHPLLVSIGSITLILSLISLGITNFVIERSNAQARILLSNSRILTAERKVLRNQLAVKHDEAARAKSSALHSQSVALQQQQIAAEQADLADTANIEAARQLALATKLSKQAEHESTRAASAKLESYTALEQTVALKKQSEDIAAAIRHDHIKQLRTHAHNLIDLNRHREAIMPLVKAVAMPDISSANAANLLGLTNELMSKSFSLTSIELTQHFSTNLLMKQQAISSTSLACVSPNRANSSYQLLYLAPNNRPDDLSLSLIELPAIPTSVLHNIADNTFVVVIPQRDATSIVVHSADSLKPPTSFVVGKTVTAATLSNSPDQILIGTLRGAGYSFNLRSGRTNVILPSTGEPITELTSHPKSSIFAFATKSTAYVVMDPLDMTATQSLELPDPIAAIQFRSPKSLTIVTSRGYVYEYPDLPNAARRTRYRPTNTASRLRNICVHQSGRILLDHSSNHLTLLNENLVPTTVHSALTTSVRTMQFTSDAKSVLTTTDRRVTTLWNCASMQPRSLAMQSDHMVIAMEYDTAAECLYTLHSDASLRAWKLPSEYDNTSAEHTIESTIERFQLMLSVRPVDMKFGITAAEAKKLLFSQANNKRD